MGVDRAEACGCCPEAAPELAGLAPLQWSGFDHETDTKTGAGAIAESIVCEWGADTDRLPGSAVAFPNITGLCELIGSVQSIDPETTGIWRLRLGGTIGDPTSGVEIWNANVPGDQITLEQVFCDAPLVVPLPGAPVCQPLKLTLAASNVGGLNLITVTTRGVHAGIRRAP